MALVLAWSCDDGGSTPADAEPADAAVPVSLIDHDRWTTDCEEGVEPEFIGGVRALSIETGRCNPARVEQPSLADLAEGDRVTGSVWHFALSAPRDGTAQVALAIAGETMFTTSIPIPAESGLDTFEWVAPRALPAGSPVVFSVQNHGANSWHLIDVERAAE